MGERFWSITSLWDKITQSFWSNSMSSICDTVPQQLRKCTSEQCRVNQSDPSSLLASSAVELSPMKIWLVGNSQMKQMTDLSFGAESVVNVFLWRKPYCLACFDVSFLFLPHLLQSSLPAIFMKHRTFGRLVCLTKLASRTELSLQWNNVLLIRLYKEEVDCWRKR